MGWSSGSRMMSDIIQLLKKHVKDDMKRSRIHYGLIEIFEENDCDTLYECRGEDPIFDVVFDTLYPPDSEVE